MTLVTPKKASTKDWHPADIKCALAKRGYTLRDIAREEGLRSSTSLSKAMHSRTCPADEKRLAFYAGVPVQEMFPERYFPDGTKMPRGMRGVFNTAKSKQTEKKNNASGEFLHQK